ncbi:MAG: hypothetical protein OEY79_03080 [Anaplasmataceae bacterium]|nr:hypothetical protein [Anaplasmataceae bacterium]
MFGDRVKRVRHEKLGDCWLFKTEYNEEHYIKPICFEGLGTELVFQSFVQDKSISEDRLISLLNVLVLAMDCIS